MSVSRSPVIIESTAIITVPKKHWPHVRRALQIHHHGRAKDYGETFITTTDHCDMLQVGELDPIAMSSLRCKFWRRVRMEMPVSFNGSLKFQAKS